MMHCSCVALQAAAVTDSDVLLQTCLVTFAYMAAQWPSFLAAFPGSSLCSGQGWPQGPNSLWLWVAQWDECRRFDNDYLILWGARRAEFQQPAAAAALLHSCLPHA